MDPPVLTDKNTVPTEIILQNYLGNVKPIWDALQNLVTQRYASFIFEWRYYNDGKSWLCKLQNTQKKPTTVCWLSIYKNYFKMTFYFGDKAELLLNQSQLPPLLKDQFFNGKKIGKIRPITIIMKTMADLEPIPILFAIKEQLK